MDRDKSIRNKDIEIFRFLRMQVIKLVAINRQSRYGFKRSMCASFLFYVTRKEDRRWKKHILYFYRLNEMIFR